MKPACRIRLSTVLLVSLVLPFSLATAQAAIVTMGVDYMFGAQSVDPNSSTTPWVAAKLQDNGDGTVNLTISNPNLTGTENVGGFYLNFDNTKNVVALQFSVVSTSGTFDSTGLNNPANYSLSHATSGSMAGMQRADGDGYFDIVINGFANGSDTTKTFGVGDTVTLKINSTAGSISVSDFLFTSDNGSLANYATAHVMNTGANFNKGAWLGTLSFAAVPESSATGLAAGLLAFGVVGGWSRHLSRPPAGIRQTASAKRIGRDAPGKEAQIQGRASGCGLAISRAMIWSPLF